VTASFSYEMVIRESLTPLVLHPEDYGMVLPDHGRFAALHASFGFSNARGFTGSISPEEGGSASLSIRWEEIFLGSEYRAFSVQGGYTHYIENPWLARHVLKLSGAFGYGTSTYKRRRLFSVGGLPQRDLVLDLINQEINYNGALRGFPRSPMRGDVVALAGGEYRFPIHDFETGYETLPIFLRTLHAALFVDAAAIADQLDELGAGIHASVGFELRLGLLLGYYIPVTLRFGWGHAIGNDPGVQNWFLVLDQSL